VNTNTQWIWKFQSWRGGAKLQRKMEYHMQLCYLNLKIHTQYVTPCLSLSYLLPHKTHISKIHTKLKDTQIMMSKNNFFIMWKKSDINSN